jgi:signal peptidase
MTVSPQLELDARARRTGDSTGAAVHLRRAGGALGSALLALAALLVLAFTVGPRVLPYRTFALVGGSMEPTIHLGSEVVVRPVRADQLRAGDVITFRSPEGAHVLVTHRIVRVVHRHGVRMFVTKGDANGLADSWRVRATGTGWRYAFSVPYLGYAIELLRQTVVRFVALAVLALFVTTLALRRIWSPTSA